MTHQNILRTRLDSQHTFQIVVYDPVTSFQSLTEMPADRIRSGYTGAVWVDQMDGLHKSVVTRKLCCADRLAWIKIFP